MRELHETLWATRVAPSIDHWGKSGLVRTHSELYWVDVQQPALHRLDPSTGLDESWTMPAWIGCLALGDGAAEGCILVGLRTGAYRFDLADGALSLGGARSL